MKRSYLFASLLAVAASSAMAQSSVSLSGTVDAGIAKRTGQATEIQSSGSRVSQLTFAGQEDLGTGLKATFLISGYIDPSTGQSDGFAKRNAFVGLEGSSFGALRIGRSFNPLYTHALTANGEFGVDTFQTMGTALNDQGRAVDNQVLYITPAWNGLTGTVSYGFSENRETKDAVGFGVRYLQGPLEATYAAARTVTMFPGMDSKYVHQIGAAYDFGVVRVLGTTQRDENASNNKMAYAFGLTAPVGKGTAWFSYDHRQMPGDSLNVVQAGYKYALSKRTEVYGQIAHRNRGSNVGLPTWGPWPVGALSPNDATGYGIGIAHSF